MRLKGFSSIPQIVGRVKLQRWSPKLTSLDTDSHKQYDMLRGSKNDVGRGRPNLRGPARGRGHYTGGQYGHVELSGHPHIEGNISTYSLLLSGYHIVRGRITGSHISLRGTGYVEGDVEGKCVNIEGQHHITGSVLGQRLVQVGGIKTRIDGTVESASGLVELCGSMRCIGAVTALQGVHAVIYGASELGRVESAGEVVISRPHTSSLILAIAQYWYDLFTPGPVTTQAVMSASKVDITNVVAHQVMAPHVRVGADSTIDVVVYSEDFVMSNGATIKECYRVPHDVMVSLLAGELQPSELVLASGETGSCDDGKGGSAPQQPKEPVLMEGVTKVDIPRLLEVASSR